MRLLQLEAHGKITLTGEFMGDDIVPPYAILSHSWGNDHDEVTIEDIKRGKFDEHKPGFRKVQIAAQLARQHGLQYLWLDTCCIDRSNPFELHEAINSMFRWYKDAARCYVHLSDVSAGIGATHDPSWRQTWESAFRHSRWFTRAWTLQELLAPHTVEFYSLEGQLLGDKVSLAHVIHEITTIPIQALQGCPLSQFSINERLSWATTRSTKREEDSAYSLLGLFDIHMPLLYGEGRANALKRLIREIKLKELEDMPTKEEIGFKSLPKSSFFQRNIFIFVLVLFILLSGIAMGICVLQSREPVCNPMQEKLRKDDGFWALLSQVFLQIIAIYCTLYPVANGKDRIKVSQIWFAGLLVVSLISCLLAPALYVTSWEAAAVLNFVSNLAAVTSLAQVVFSIETQGGRDPDMAQNGWKGAL